MDEFDDIARRASEAVRAEARRVADTERALADVGRATAASRAGRWVHVQRPVIAAAVLAIAAMIATVVVVTRDNHTRVATAESTAVRASTTTPVTTASASTTPATTSPQTSFTTTPSTTATSGSVPKSAQPLSAAWFASPSEGWVIASVPDTTFAVVLHTTNGGSRWSRFSVTPLSSDPNSLDCGSTLTVRFADATNGWVNGCSMLSTHDGGLTWSPVTLSTVGPGPFAMDIAGGHVYAFDWSPDDSLQFTVYSSPIERDAFVASSARLRVGAGPVIDPKMAVGADKGWVIFNDRTPTSAARLVNGQWKDWDPQHAYCAGETIPVTSRSADALVVACTDGTWGPATTESVRLFLSRDGGASFYETTQPPGARSDAVLSSAARPAAGHLVVSYTTGWTAGNPTATLASSDNDGKTWIVLSTGSAFTDLQFLTVDDGVARIGNTIVVTHDGGRSWTTVLG